MKRRILLIIEIVIVIICEIAIIIMPISLQEQRIYQKWDSQNATQISIFLPEINHLTYESILDFENELKEEYNLVSSYSYQKKYNLIANNRETDVTLNYVGGHYFYFHPFKFQYGNGFMENETKNVCVIDENIAYKFYGATNVIGKIISVMNNDYEIIGITQANNDIFSGQIFIPCYDYPTLAMTEYEIVMRNPNIEQLKKFANGQCILIENKKRFTEWRILKGFVNMNEYMKQDIPIVYPMWEKRAQLVLLRLSTIIIVKYIILAIFLITFNDK